MSGTPPTKRSEARVVHSFGRADTLDRDALQRLVKSINRVLEAGDPPRRPVAASCRRSRSTRVFELGVVLAARALWEELGIGEAVRRRLDAAGLSAPHEAALFAMAAQRLDEPGSKLACAERWLPDVAWLPEAERAQGRSALPRARCPGGLHAEAIERDVFLRDRRPVPARCRPDLLRHHDGVFEIDEADEDELWAGAVRALRQRGHAKEGRDRRPAGGDRARRHPRRHAGALLGAARQHRRCRHGGADQGGSAGLAARPLRAVGDAGLYSADNLSELGRGLGRYILAVPMRKLKEVEAEVLARPGRYRKLAANLQVKEVWVGEGERRRRYVRLLQS